MRLEFEFVKRETGKWVMFEDDEVLPNPFTSRTKAENREKRDAHKALKGVTHFKKIYEW